MLTRLGEAGAGAFTILRMAEVASATFQEISQVVEIKRAGA